MTDIYVNFNNIKGKIRAMHAVGQPPFTGGFLTLDFSHINYLKEAHIPYSRLHDVGGAFGGFRYVDIPNIFRDFDSDVNDEESYDFAFTDELIKAMISYKVDPIFRLGVTIENQAHIKAYRIHPPKDFSKWASICEHIIRHYNEGWANGFEFGIKYWEIWNEPENGVPGKNQMWTGTKEEYYELYTVTSKHLKACFGDNIKVGGYGATTLGGIFYDPKKYGLDCPKDEIDDKYEKYSYRLEFLYGFLDYIKKNQAPLDFFSWHSYAGLMKTGCIADFVDKTLGDYGYDNVETHLNEWNFGYDGRLTRGKSVASASAAAMMCMMQDKKTTVLCYYDAKIGIGNYAGFFDAYTYEPVCTYYVFKAFGELYALGSQVECKIEADGLYAVSAKNEEKKAVLLSNVSGESQDIKINLDSDFKVYLIDENNFTTETNFNPCDFRLENNQVVLIKNY